MKEMIILFSTIGVILIFIHEFDAFHYKEWLMFRFLRNFSKQTQYLIFLYAHIPLTLFLLYYLWTVVIFCNIMLWILMNILLIIHFIIHLFALKWKSNVFHSIHSFIIIAAAAITGIINLFLIGYY